MRGRDDERRLDDDDVARRLAEIPGWHREGDAIERTYTRRGFADAIALVNRIAALASAQNHHPDIHLERYRRVRVVLTTHVAGGLSEADFRLARSIDEAAGA